MVCLPQEKMTIVKITLCFLVVGQGDLFPRSNETTLVMAMSRDLKVFSPSGLNCEGTTTI